MEDLPIKKGEIISGPMWPEPVLEKFSEHQDGYIHIIGATTKSNQHIDQLIPLSDLSNIQSDTGVNYFTHEAWKVFLALGLYVTAMPRFTTLSWP